MSGFVWPSFADRGVSSYWIVIIGSRRNAGDAYLENDASTYKLKIDISIQRGSIMDDLNRIMKFLIRIPSFQYSRPVVSDPESIPEFNFTLGRFGINHTYAQKAGMRTEEDRLVWSSKSADPLPRLIVGEPLSKPFNHESFTHNHFIGSKQILMLYQRVVHEEDTIR
ncbi:hypothetical protein RF11_10772 [Thelohanellus kitauei]|uniref:Uncharacterized protein n=1 Tax=Thelohanellus kitauei TaxID=669202 RepID=A0A0C2MD17_THEKT|nr:hypothetical protein RF11_10772 [Thelohanellus kitauei]